MRYVLALVLFITSAFAQQGTKQVSQSLRDSSLSSSDRLAIEHKIRTDPDSSDLSDDELLDTKIDLVDLDDDGVLEILAKNTNSTNCGATGNCTFWILQKKGAEYRVLLKSLALRYRIRTIKTGGFSDIELAQHMSADSTEWRGYKYNGSRYIKVKCWASVTGDSEHEYPKPKIEPCTKR